jgi:hypothetical protein
MTRPEWADWAHVTRFQFTWAIPGGAWLEMGNGHRNWFGFAAIAQEKGQAWIDRQLKRQGWMTGCWIDVE